MLFIETDARNKEDVKLAMRTVAEAAIEVCVICLHPRKPKCAYFTSSQISKEKVLKKINILNQSYNATRKWLDFCMNIPYLSYNEHTNRQTIMTEVKYCCIIRVRDHLLHQINIPLVKS